VITTAKVNSFLCYCCGCFDEEIKSMSNNNNSNSSNNNKMKKLNIFAPKKRHSDQQNSPPTTDTLHRIVNAKEEVRGLSIMMSSNFGHFYFLHVRMSGRK